MNSFYRKSNDASKRFVGVVALELTYHVGVLECAAGILSTSDTTLEAPLHQTHLKPKPWGWPTPKLVTQRDAILRLGA